MLLMELVNLFEIKIGDIQNDALNKSEYWVLQKDNTITVFPKNADIGDDALKAFNYDNWDEAEDDPNAPSWLNSNVPYYGLNDFFIVDNKKAVINLDITRFRKRYDRRPNAKVSEFDKAAKDAYPILGSNLAFDRLDVLIKSLKALIKLDPRTKNYEVVGDLRIPQKSTAGDIVNNKINLQTAQKFLSGREDIKLYHGTSLKLAEIILRDGLRPNSRGFSYSDMIENYSSKNVYFAISPTEAANYATRQAIDDSSDAVILEITLNPMQIQRLVADEDEMNWFKDLPKTSKTSFLDRNPIVRRIWGDDFSEHFAGFNHTDGKFDLGWLFKSDDDTFYINARKVLAANGIKSKADLPPLEKHLYTELIRTYISAAVISNIKSSGVLAYPGNIAPSKITIKKQWSLTGSKIPANTSQKQFQKAIDKQAATVVR